jgi:hypothetical protein
MKLQVVLVAFLAQIVWSEKLVINRQLVAIKQFVNENNSQCSRDLRKILQFHAEEDEIGDMSEKIKKEKF